MPSIFPAVQIGDDAYWDGLFSDNPPVEELIRPRSMGEENIPDEIWLIKINPTGRQQRAGQAGEIIDRRNQLEGNISLFQQLGHLDMLNDMILADAFRPEFLARFDIKAPVRIPKSFHSDPDRPYHIPCIEMPVELQDLLDYERQDRSRAGQHQPPDGRGREGGDPFPRGARCRRRRLATGPGHKLPDRCSALPPRRQASVRRPDRRSVPPALSPSRRPNVKLPGKQNEPPPLPLPRAEKQARRSGRARRDHATSPPGERQADGQASRSRDGRLAMLRRRLLRRIAYLRRNRCSVLLAGLLVFILVHPLLLDSAIGGTFLAFGTLSILLLGLWALHARRRTLLLVGILALLTFQGIAADRLGEHWLRPATLLVTAAFMGAITAALLYYVLDWQPITIDKVFGAWRPMC